MFKYLMTSFTDRDSLPSATSLFLCGYDTFILVQSLLFEYGKEELLDIFFVLCLDFSYILKIRHYLITRTNKLICLLFMKNILA